ncbi:hypothetical protein D3C81_1590940 [compost metagenome]
MHVDQVGTAGLGPQAWVPAGKQMAGEAECLAGDPGLGRLGDYASAIGNGADGQATRIDNTQGGRGGMQLA